MSRPPPRCLTRDVVRQGRDLMAGLRDRQATPFIGSPEHRRGQSTAKTGGEGSCRCGVGTAALAAPRRRAILVERPVSSTQSAGIEIEVVRARAGGTSGRSLRRSARFFLKRRRSRQCWSRRQVAAPAARTRSRPWPGRAVDRSRHAGGRLSDTRRPRMALHDAAPRRDDPASTASRSSEDRPPSISFSSQHQPIHSNRV